MEPSTPDASSFLASPPAEIKAVIQRATETGGRLELLGRHLEAFEVFRYAYEVVLGSQPTGRRYHKGEPLANMGWVQHRSGARKEGAKWTSLAFIEDALSRAEELPGILDELSRPAAQNLRKRNVLVHQASPLRHVHFRKDPGESPPATIRQGLHARSDLVVSPSLTQGRRRWLSETLATLASSLESWLTEAASHKDPPAAGQAPERSGI